MWVKHSICTTIKVIHGSDTLIAKRLWTKQLVGETTVILFNLVQLLCHAAGANRHQKYEWMSYSSRSSTLIVIVNYGFCVKFPLPSIDINQKMFPEKVVFSWDCSQVVTWLSQVVTGLPRCHSGFLHQGCQMAWVRISQFQARKKPKRKLKKAKKDTKRAKKHKLNLIVKNLEHIIIAVECQSDVHLIMDSTYMQT